MSEYTIDWSNSNTNIDGANTIGGPSGNQGFTVSTPENVDHQDWDKGNIDGYSGLKASCIDDPTVIEIGFDQGAENITFEIFDVDSNNSTWDDRVTVVAKDANGNILPVNFSDLASHHSVNGNQLDTNGNANPGVEGSGATDSVTVSIPGPIASLEIIYDNGSGASSSGTIGLSDIHFDAAPQLDGYVEGTSGNDTIDVAYAGDPDGDCIDAGDEVLPGEDHDDDIVLAGGGDDLVLAGDGDDEVYGESGNDTLCGMDGDDVLYGGAGNDVIEGMNDNDVMFGGTGSDAIYGDAGDDVASGGTGNDTIHGGTGEDLLSGGKGNDTINAGSDDDVVIGGGGSDNILGGAGNDTLIGGNMAFDGTQNFSDLSAGDLVEGQYIAEGVTITSADPTNPVMVFDTSNPTGGDTDLATGNLGNVLILSEDRDGSDPDDNAGGGTFNITFEGPASVSSLTLLDADGGAWVKYYDVSGNLLQQVDVTTADNGQHVVSTSLTNVGSIEVILGNSGAIDNLSYSIHPDDCDAADIIDGGAGDDYIEGNAGNDDLSGGTGDDVILGGAGDDTLEGGDGNDLLCGDDEEGAPVEMTLVWDDVAADGTQVPSGGLSYDAGGVTVQVGFTAHDEGANATIVNNQNYVEAGEGFDADSSLKLGGQGGEGGFDNTSTTTLDFTPNSGDFADEVNNVSFRLNDVDLSTSAGDTHIDRITVRAFDADGNEVDVVLTPETAGQSVNDQTVTGEIEHGAGVTPASQAGSVLVNIAGPVARIEVDYDNGGLTSQIVTVTDVVFSATSTAEGEAGDDDLFGGDGDDILYGKAGDDLLDGGAGADILMGGSGSDTILGGAGDTVDGGATGTDHDVLDLTGQGSYILENVVSDTTTGGNGNGINGTVVFVDGNGDPTGETLTFTDIEEIIGDEMNQGPEANDDTATVDEDGSVNINVLGNDTDPDGDDLTVTEATSPDGDVTINADGTLTFEPNPDFNGDTTITYTVDDGNGGTDTATVTVTVNSVNDDPVAVLDERDADEDTVTYLGNVLDNDSDIDGDTLEVIRVEGLLGNVGDPVEGSNGGLITINDDGTSSFDPNGDFDGLAAGETTATTVMYTISDGNGGTAVAEVVVTVTGTNDDPVAEDSSYIVAQDEAFGDVDGNAITDDTGEGADSDVDGDALTVAAVDGAAGNVGQVVDGDNGGEFIINANGTVDFNANGDFDELGDGEEASTSVTYTITDPEGGQDTATVTFTVTGTNDGPVATNDADETDEDTAIVLDNVLGNDTDPDGDDLTVSEVNGATGNVGEPVVGDNGGLITINEDGSASFDPNGDFDSLPVGETAETSVTYTITDGNGGEDTTTVTVTVNGLNDDPVAEDDAATTDFNTPVDIPVLDNDNDVDGDPLTVIDATSPDGEVEINGDGTITFTPNDGFEGEATITYTVTDPNGAEDTAEVTVIVSDDPRDGIVEGTNDDDVIDVDYTGDPDGDFVDNDDALLPGEEGDDDIIFGYGGNDDITAGEGDDEVSGGAGDDTIQGNNGDDVLDGNGGNDTIFGGNGDDVIDGGSGDDTIGGGSGNDTIIGGGGEDTINGGGGADTITGGNNEDVIDGGTGDDTIFGGGSDDTIIGASGSDTVDGGTGNDFIDTSGSSPAPDLGYPGLFEGDDDPTNDNDVVDGGAGNDTIITGDDDDIIDGGTGNDTIDAGFDDDTVDGGDGDDRIVGGEGSDTILGGDGDDTIYAGNDPDLGLDSLNIEDDGTNPFGPDLVPNNGMDFVDGGAGNDTIFGADDDDTLLGGTGDDYIDGGIDDDTLDGGEGDDTLIGGQGDDTIEGGDGDDTITGGIGEDTLSGGFGDDLFIGGNAGDVVVGGEDPDGNDVDVLDLTGSDVASIDYTDGDPESGVVNFADGSTMTFSEIENVIPCFTPGTTIATPSGERLVEELREGDKIITRDNGIQEIRWLGSKALDARHLMANPHLKPVLIKAGSLGNGLPERDMMVSPNHRMLVANEKTALFFEEREVLAAAKHLVGAEGIHKVDALGTTYIHMMFDQHEVVLSNGSWSESFQPGDYTLKGIGNAQRNEIFELFPELKTAEGVEDYQSARVSLKKHEVGLLMK